MAKIFVRGTKNTDFVPEAMNAHILGMFVVDSVPETMDILFSGTQKDCFVPE